MVQWLADRGHRHWYRTTLLGRLVLRLLSQKKGVASERSYVWLQNLEVEAHYVPFR